MRSFRWWRPAARDMPPRGTGRRTFGRFWSSIANCAELPKPQRHIAGRESQADSHAVRPLVVILEIGAVIPACAEGKDAVRIARQLPAQIGRNDEVSVTADKV